MMIGKSIRISEKENNILIVSIFSSSFRGVVGQLK